MKRKKAALFDPYLDVLGGGEKHIFSILKVLEEQNYSLSVFWNRNLQKKIEDQFSLRFRNKITFLPNIFRNSTSRLIKLLALKDFDVFFYVTDGSYFFSTAKKNFIFCMVPQKNLYVMNPLNRLKTARSHFIANSEFTQKWLASWGIRAQMIHPYISNDFLLKDNNVVKEKIILSVGRFYSHLHAKRQDVLIKWFKKIKHKDPMFKDFKLILTGGLKKEDINYFNLLKKGVTSDQSIELKSNISYGELVNLYKKSLFYVHVAGFGVDENVNPSQVEHLGIAPLEAMLAGCITFCFKAGGPKEIITDGSNGFLFTSLEELSKKIKSVMSDKKLQSDIRISAKKYVTKNFSYEVFKNKVLQVIV